MKSKKLPTTILGTLASGEQVIDRPISHLQGDVTSLLPEVLAKISSDKRAQIVELIDLERVWWRRAGVPRDISTRGQIIWANALSMLKL